MPIVLNDDNKVSVLDVTGNVTKLDTKLYSPKFFHNSVLTGKGGQSRGLLCEARDPKNYKNGYHNSVNPNLSPGTHYNKDIKIYDIPCYLISPSLWDKIETFDRPELPEMTCIAKKGTEEVYLTMPIHALQIEERTSPGPAGSSVTVTSRDLSACMHMFLFSVKDPTVTTHIAVNTPKALKKPGNVFYRDVIFNMFSSLVNIEHVLTTEGYTVDRDAMNDFVQNYSLYTELCKSAEKWLNHTDYFMADVLVKNIDAYVKLNPHESGLWNDASFSVAEMLSRLEKYSVPLDQYQNMYAKMTNIVAPDVLSQICKFNLNLRLSNTLQHMNQNRAQLQTCQCVNHIQSTIPYSKEQREAIESTSPLTLVQSGAGTGKSTVILGRIDHMVANGVNPNDITVLSFTNAAANHINDLKPTVHSMTIASMLHAIYSHNYPSHQLSSLATIINSLDIYFNPNATTMTQAQENFIYDFKYTLERLQNNNEYTRANNFVEDHLDEVLATLDVIQQTSLEIESIICYQKMDTLIEPPETQTKHLIIDEVQDNSIAEFIYSIRYTDKHQCSMYIVGDCSQTLYEFRSSNPKALNVLENSGVFETHKLQTNYRSNQEILDFANVLLGNIEANQYANIQLRANSLQPVTLQSFQDAVTLFYNRMPNKSPNTYDNLYTHSIVIDTRNYITDKLAKGEQICILAPQRRALFAIEKHLQSAFPGTTIASLIPKRQYDNALFSKFIARYWDTIVYAPPTNITATIRREIINKAPYMSHKGQANLQKTIDIANKMMDEFEGQFMSSITNWQNQVAMSVMTQLQLLDEIKKLMIGFEIKRNAVAQALMSVKNAEAKSASDIDNANFILSTIHSAKGLEFDNVIVYYQSESESNMDEATKRMYYVAFTRAKKTEFIYAYDTLARPKIQGDYEKIIKDLTAKAQAPTGDPADDDSATTDATVNVSDTAESTVENAEPNVQSDEPVSNEPTESVEPTPTDTNAITA